MHNVEIPRRRGHALKDCGSHADHDELNATVSEPDEDLVKFGLFGCHGEF